MKKKFTSVFILVMIFVLTGISYAGSQTATLYVKATVVASVSVTCSPLVFPAFDNMAAGIPVQGEGQVNVNSSVNYNVSLDSGRYYNGSVRCLDSAKNLQYRLYQDSARTIEWGDSDFAGTYPAGSSKNGTAGDSIHTVYGTLSTAAVDEGEYQDSVIVTVIY